MGRYTIRSLMACTLLVALIIAIPVRNARNQARGREWVAKQRGHISFKYPLDRATGNYEIPHIPKFFVRLFGVDMFNPVTGVVLDCETVESFAPLTYLSSLESLGVVIDMDDEIDFSPLRGLPRLREIYFANWSGITVEQLRDAREKLPRVSITSDLPGDV